MREPSSVRQRSAARAIWLAGALAAALPGCLAQPGDEEIGVALEALNDNSHAAFDYFLAKGLTPVQAAGIVGNLMQESSCNPNAVQPGGPGRGIAQWSVGGRWDRSTNDNAVAYAASHRASVWSLGLQLDFIWYELTTFSGYGLAQLRAATTVSAAVTAFQNRYEICGTCVQTQRLAYANQALAAYGGDASSAWGARFVSQTFPYAAAGAVAIVAGRTASVSITMHNTGTRAWDSRTCIATTTPRDRRSPFAGAEWRAANRPACVPAGTTVASGANHTFTWLMHAPATPGRYDERWGMVEEGTAWFSDPGQGGPPDNDLEGIFTVTVAPPPPPAADAGPRDAGVRDASADATPRVDATPPGDAAGDDAAGDDAASDDAASDDAAGDDAASDDAASDDAAGDDAASDDAARPLDDPTPAGCGCRVSSPRAPTPAPTLPLLAVALCAVRARRRRQR